jgi:D-alanyl-lipoteichoic acid acyltransferase DltB (MBOAT superfamily)
MTLRDILRYDPTSPLTFHSGTFFLFFSALVVTYLPLQGRRLRLGWLLGFSWFYYYKCSGPFMAALLGTTLADFVMAHAIDRAERPWLRKLLLTTSIASSLSLLGYFKYASFILENWALIRGRSFEPLAIVMPVGISFYTFQSLSYVIDVYRRQVAPSESLLEYAFYLSFFPQVVAGPIVRARDFFPQIRRLEPIRAAAVAEGLARICGGLAKKALIADYLGAYVDLVYTSPQIYSGPEIALALYAYALQVYFDFSGYSDMAIGMAKILGFELPENFDAPYRAASVAEFWRRWHITLSSWVRDYLFFPLSMRAGRRMALRYASLIVAMTLVGLWHGASYNFVLWGTVHGAALALHAWWSRRTTAGDGLGYRAAAWLGTVHFIVLSWVLFRAKDLRTAGLVLSRLTSGPVGLGRIAQVASARSGIVAVMAIGAALALAGKELRASLTLRFVRTPVWLKAAVFAALVQCVLEVRTSYLQPFIYFQF